MPRSCYQGEDRALITLAYSLQIAPDTKQSAER